MTLCCPLMSACVFVYLVCLDIENDLLKLRSAPLEENQRSRPSASQIDIQKCFPKRATRCRSQSALFSFFFFFFFFPLTFLASHRCAGVECSLGKQQTETKNETIRQLFQQRHRRLQLLLCHTGTNCRREHYFFNQQSQRDGLQNASQALSSWPLRKSYLLWGVERNAGEFILPPHQINVSQTAMITFTIWKLRCLDSLTTKERFAHSSVISLLIIDHIFNSQILNKELSCSVLTRCISVETKKKKTTMPFTRHFLKLQLLPPIFSKSIMCSKSSESRLHQKTLRNELFTIHHPWIWSQIMTHS